MRFTKRTFFRKRWLLLLCALFVLLPSSFRMAREVPPAQAWSRGSREGTPKIANIFLTSNLGTNDWKLDVLQKYDLLILDADFPYWNPHGIADLKARNPNIKILASWAIEGGSHNTVWDPVTIHRQYSDVMDQHDFWLYDTTGNHVSDWPQKWTANTTSFAVSAIDPTLHYDAWFSDFVVNTIWDNGSAGWDGIYFDDVWDSISWLNTYLPSPMDSNRDGIADDATTLNADWKATNGRIVENIRSRLGPNVIIMSNGQNTHYTSLNGTMLENFPCGCMPTSTSFYKGQWERWMLTPTVNYFTWLEQYLATPDKTMIINTMASGTRDAPSRTTIFEQHKRMTLGSTLLDDGYYSLDAYDHAETWWEVEYDLYIGTPRGDHYTEVDDGLTLYRRDYTDAIVVVNPNLTTAAATAEHPAIPALDAYIGVNLSLCQPDWQCEAWEACVGDVQSRTCTDRNHCVGADPPDEQACDRTPPAAVTDLRVIP